MWKKIKDPDTNRIQQTTKDNLVDRYSRLYSNLQRVMVNPTDNISITEIGLFRDYEEMDNDPIFLRIDIKMNLR